MAIRVRPGAPRTVVGGTRGGRLLVWVTARAVDGAATEAALVAVADAFGLRRRAVALRSGPTSRDKLVELELPDAAALDVARERLAELSEPGRAGTADRPRK